MANTYQFYDIPDDIKDRYPERINPLLPTYYRFHVTRLPATVYFCQSASLPTVTMSEVQMPTPFMPIKSPSKMDYDELSITFIVDEEMKNWLEIFNWMRSCTNVENYEEFTNHHIATGNLIILNSNKNPKMSVTFEGLFPRTLGSIDFSSTIMDPEAIQCTATFGYRNYNIELF